MMRLPAIILVSLASFAAPAVNVLPLPREVIESGDSVALSMLKPVVIEADTTLAPEAYTLTVTPQGEVKITASSPAGELYGRVTLSQLREHATDSLLAAVTISDSPRFPYRGVLMDNPRYFLGYDAVLKLLDEMVRYKLNVLHLPLGNDQGWRLESLRYPRLVTVGSHRAATQIGHADDHVPPLMDSIPHDGYFTRAEMRAIIDSAAARNITVIPEVEMPGHVKAMLAAYPELGCNPAADYEVEGRWDIFDDVLCPTDSTISFLCNLLDEVIDLFPSAYIHIGGDECPRNAWRDCPRCRETIARYNLDGVDALQNHLMRRINDHLTARGRRCIAWDEALEGGEPPRDITIMSWRGEQGAIKAAAMGRDVILTPGDYLYLDFYQEDIRKSPLCIGGWLPLEKVYSYNPEASIPESQQRHILGIQGNVWGEYCPDMAKYEYLAFPRLLAVAEKAWGTGGDYQDFSRRLRPEFDHFDKAGINACRAFITGTDREPEPAAHGYSAIEPRFSALTDGIVGSIYDERRWLEVTPGDTITIDLGEELRPNHLDLTFMYQPGWRHCRPPQAIEVLTSHNDYTYRPPVTTTPSYIIGTDSWMPLVATVPLSTPSRYIKIIFTPQPIPAPYHGAGEPGRILITEITPR